MRRAPERGLALLCCAGLLALAGCGGGGGDAERPAGAPAPQSGTAPGPSGTSATGTGPSAPEPMPQANAPVVLSGTVATGAPLVGASLVVHDAGGASVCTQTIGADGVYACAIEAGARAPFVVIATRDDTRLVSVRAEATSGTVNVTPLTHLIAATLSPSGDPVRLVDEIRTAPATIDPARLRASVERVMTALRPLLETLGTTTDPIAGRFAADGTGHDQLLDLLQVSVRPEVSANGSAANIEVTVRARPTSAEAPPVSIAFRSDAPSVPALDRTAVSAAAIPAAGVNVALAMADLLRRLNACYALPQATRVTQGTAYGSTVQAPECRGLFADDDPSTYLHGGARVGPNGAFKGLFSSTVGVVFDRPNFEFMRANGDYVIGYRWTAPNGSTDNDQIVVRRQGDRFKAIGNQYAYDSRVRSFAQWRDLVNSPTFSSLSTGYNVWIANRTDGNGQAIFTKVEVTTPRGNTLTYLPSDGMGWLVRARADGTPSTTPVLRLAARWIDPANTASLPQKESGMLLIDPPMSDAELRDLPDQSVWKLEFFHRDGSPNVIQTHRTTSRALTLGEVAATVFAEATPAARAALRATSGASGRYTFVAPPSAGTPSWVDLSVDGAVRDFWRVPSGAVAPTSVSLFGRAPGGGASFSDTAPVASIARAVQIRCSAQTVADTHCDAGLRDQYAVGGWFNAIELWARSSRQVELSTMLGLYTLQ